MRNPYGPAAWDIGALSENEKGLGPVAARVRAEADSRLVLPKTTHQARMLLAVELIVHRLHLPRGQGAVVIGTLLHHFDGAGAQQQASDLDVVRKTRASFGAEFQFRVISGANR